MGVAFLKMKEFNYLSYHTEYSCTGTFNKKMSKEVCFARVFHNVKDDSDIVYTIILYPGVDFCVKHHRSNACLFNRHEVENHLRQLRGIFPFSYRVLEKINKDDQVYYGVTLHIKEVPATFHKYVLTWLRYTYEFPYNVILRDAYRLKKDPIFRFESISNIFNIVSNCSQEYVGEGHSIAEASVHKPLKKDQLRERIKAVNELNSIYTILNANKPKLPENIGKFGTRDLGYWSEELFEHRKPIYMEMYNIIKKRKK